MNHDITVAILAIVAIVAVLMGTIGGLCIGINAGYRAALGLVPVQMPRWRSQKTIVEAGEEKGEGTALPKVGI